MNKYFERDGYIVGLTSKGQEFLFDKEDLDVVQHFSWSVNSLGYVLTNDYSNGAQMIYFHRMILQMEDPKKVVDHVNHNKLDNMKSNLRICSQSENQGNRRMSKNNVSGFKGVDWKKQELKWRVQIYYRNKPIHIGLFTDILEAAKAYNDAALKYFGEFAKLNEIND